RILYASARPNWSAISAVIGWTFAMPRTPSVPNSFLSTPFSLTNFIGFLPSAAKVDVVLDALQGEPYDPTSAWSRRSAAPSALAAVTNRLPLSAASVRPFAAVRPNTSRPSCIPVPVELSVERKRLACSVDASRGLTLASIGPNMRQNSRPASVPAPPKGGCAAASGATHIRSSTMQIHSELVERRKARPDGNSLGFGRILTDHMLVARYEESKGWYDARIVPYGPLQLDPAAAVLHYGQELFEGLKAYRGKDGVIRLFRPEENCRRMADGARRLCMPPISEEDMLQMIMELVAVEKDWVPHAEGTALYIRPTLVATEPFLGVRPSKSYLFFVILSPVGAYYAEGFDPVKIWVEPKYSRAARGGLGAVKAGANYAASLLASELARAKGYAQVLWLDANEHRWLEEVGTMNLFLRIGDEVVTPPLGGSILPGITRDSVIRLLRHWGVPVDERPISID